MNTASKNVSRAKARRSVKKPKYFTLGGGVSNAGDDEQLVTDGVVPAGALPRCTAQSMHPVDVQDFVADTALHWLASEAGAKP